MLADDPGRAEDGEKVGRLHAQKTWRLPGGDGASGEVGFRLGIAHLVSSANREASWHSSIKMPQDWWRLGNLEMGGIDQPGETAADGAKIRHSLRAICKRNGS